MALPQSKAALDAAFAQFTADLVAAASQGGPAGPKGPTGAQGPTGSSGQAGPKGSQGVTGPTGAAGVSPPVSTAKLLWSDEFTTLDIASPSNPNGKWRPDAFWQNLSGGYEDFAGNSYNLNPNEKAPLNINPFSIGPNGLTISCKRIPDNLKPAVRASMDAQGQTQASPAWMGGFITTANGFNQTAVPKFKYGYFEFKMALPKPGQGMFPALWLYASEGGADPQGKPAAEIDILEVFGIANQWSTSLHGATGRTVGTRTEDTAGMHVYGLDWQPTYLRFYRDNVMVYETTSAEAAWFNTTMVIIMNYSMDAPWFPVNAASNASTPILLTMDIRYVRVYDQKP